MQRDPLFAISPIDGRYHARVALLAPFLSEHALMGYRLRVETEYLIALSEIEGFGPRSFTEEEKSFLRELPLMTGEEAQVIKDIEERGHAGIPATNHDVKAVEYYIRLRIAGSSLADVAEWVHFGTTSEDVDNLSRAMMLRDACEQVLIPAAREIVSALDAWASLYAELPMLARTHGQPASPTTFGKEMRVFADRLRREVETLSSFALRAKWSGATGSHNALVAAAPGVDWVSFSERFIARASGSGASMRILPTKAATQVDPQDSYAELFQILYRMNTILIAFDQDMWRYISDGWVVQKAVAGEIGSSTMPHKVNPIDFEQSEGNAGLANALFEFFARKLPISRLQRDLSDSTVKRAIGTALAHSLVSYTSTLKGIGKSAPSAEAMRGALAAHPEVLAEAIQIILRREGAPQGYEMLKEVVRGKQVTLEGLRAFVRGLSVREEVKRELLALTPETYTGVAERIARG